MQTVRTRTAPDTGWDSIVVAALIAAAFLLQVWHLHGAAMPATDEGVYGLAGRLMMNGYLPHRDFPLWHMPLLPFLMGMGLELTGGLFPLRLAYLAVNCLAVFPLHAILKRLTGHHLAALTGVAFYLTFREMVDHDFRLIAIRQLANVLLIVFVWCGVCAGERPWRKWVQAACWLSTVLLFLPASLNMALAAAALTVMAPRKQRIRLLQEYGLMLAWTTIVAGVYLLTIDGALRQVVMEQVNRPRVTRWWRVLHISRSPDAFFATVGTVSLLLGAVFLPRLRAMCAAMLAITGLSVFVSTNYFDHYISLAGPALALGAAVGVTLIDRGVRLVIIERFCETATLAACVVLVSFQAAKTMPLLLRTWDRKATPGYANMVTMLAKQPDPVLISQAVFAAEADVQALFAVNVVLFRPPYPQRVPPQQLTEAAQKACTIFLDGSIRHSMPAGMAQKWTDTYTTIFKNEWGVVLRTENPGCPPVAAAQ